MNRLGLLLSGLFLSSTLYATNYGLVVGCCGEYETLDKNLKGTTNDAKAFAKTLSRGCDRKNITLLIDKDSTKENIKANLKRLEKILQPKDRLYFYFSGHGARAGDKKVFMQEIESDDDLNRRLDKTALITYNYNSKDAYNTALITAEDLQPLFTRLDNLGVEIIMFADACFAGESFRSSASDRIKRLENAQMRKVKRAKSTKTEYKNLIFFGASLNSKQAREIDTKYGKRGEFSLYLEYCLDNGDSNGDKQVSKAELHKCMIDEFPSYASESSVYPTRELGSVNILKAKIANHKRDRTLPKIKYSGKTNLTGVATLVNSGYELEIVSNGNEYDIFKAGIPYVSIDKRQLTRYLKAYRLFALNSKGRLEVKYKSHSTGKVEDTYCAGELIDISVKNMRKNHQMIVLTLDKNGRVIILKSRGNFAQTQVFPPYNGVDVVKVFTFNNRDIYKKAVAYQNTNSGILSTPNINTLYELLSKEQSLRGQAFSIRTTSNSLKQCIDGAR